MMRSFVILLFSLAFLPAAAAQEKAFSGPQPGEKLLPFKVRTESGGQENKELDLVKQAAGKPLILFFMNQFDGSSAQLVRSLTRYVNTRANDMSSGIVWLTDDP